jgi:hypothetical protein
MSTFPENRRLAFGRLYPGELGSLWDVIEFNAPRFHYLMTWLTMTETVLSITRWRSSTDGVQIAMHGALHADQGQEFDDHIKNLVELGLNDCATVLGRIKVCYFSQGQPGQTQERLEELLRDFRQRLYDALKGPKFLVLSAREQALYEPPAPYFGQQVNASFPSITYEMLISEDTGPGENASIQCIAALISVETHRCLTR